MKYYLRYLVLFVSIVFTTTMVNAVEKTWEYNCKRSDFSNANVKKSTPATLNLNNVVWTFVTDCAEFTTNNGGVQIGSGTNKVGDITFSSSAFSNYMVSSIKVNAQKAKAPSAWLTVSVGDKKYAEVGMNYNVQEYTFTGTSSGDININFSQSGNAGMTIISISVTYIIPDITLSESEDNSSTISEHLNDTLDVALNRTLQADKWNTLCLPFGFKVNGSALEGADVKSVASIEGNVFKYQNDSTIEAGRAYLVKPKEQIVNPTFSNVAISAAEPTVGATDYDFVGIYSPMAIDDNNYGEVMFVNSEGKVVGASKGTMNGMRAYFKVPKGNTNAKLDLGGDVSGIEGVACDKLNKTKRVYSINGQYMGSLTDGLQPSVYIVDGKKVLINK